MTAYDVHNPWGVEVDGLTKSYGGTAVLTGLDLRVGRGEVVALLGPNGAGKTTLVRILATLLRPDGGRARVAGLDVTTQRRQVRRLISLTGQEVAVDGQQTGEENLRTIGRIAGLDAVGARARSRELLARFDLAEAGRRRVATYSGGMRRRLDLAAGLLTRPQVLFLDEPTTGLDPRSRQGMWDVVKELVADGVTVLLTTQYLEEADQLADRVAVIAGGRIIADDSPSALKRRVADQRLELALVDDAAYQAVARALVGRATRCQPTERRVMVATDGSATHVRALLDELDPAGRRVERFSLHGATLDDVFLTLTAADQGAQIRA
jgi:ABC-2 type transport system ATP-binding protein